ncbi:MAG: site-specific integrase [Coprobacter fastidiosus]|jgi:integrase/recombinase XerD|nr:MAG: site-specific integrase [Coprobacter fastidiosus]
MTVAKFKVVIRREKLSKSTNEAPVCLRITKDRKVTYKTLLHVSPDYWDEKEQCVKKQHPNAVALNAVISKRKAELEKETCFLSLRDDSVSIETIRNKINDRTSFDLFEYAEKYIENLRKNQKHATYKKYKSVIKKLRLYVGKETLPIKSISLDFIKEYENYLMNHIGNNRNTTTVNLKALAKLVGDIYRNYDMDETGNPFRKIKFKREQTERTYLEIDEIRKIQDLKLRLQSPLYDARELFLFECYTGIRISDILTLKWKNVANDKISIRMRKTEKPLIVPMNDFVKAVLDKRRAIVENNGGQILPDKYVFNILKVDVDKVNAQDALNAISSATAIINKQLKRIAEKVGIEKNISTHVGRHSYATALLTSDIPLPVIKEMLGHSDIKVTQIYAKVVDSKKNEVVNCLNKLYHG